MLSGDVIGTKRPRSKERTLGTEPREKVTVTGTKPEVGTCRPEAGGGERPVGVSAPAADPVGNQLCRRTEHAARSLLLLLLLLKLPISFSLPS